jgi:hypothetical protein
VTWWWLIPAVLGAPLSLVLHEASHALVGIAKGCRIVAFRPWPHRHGNRWLVGAVYLDRGMGAFRPISSLAPLIKSMVLIPTWLLLASLTTWHLAPLAFWELVDAGQWWRNWYRRRGTDGAELREEAER